MGIYICYYIRLLNPDLRFVLEIKLNEILNRKFIQVPNEEKEFIINQIELEPGIGKNNNLKENVFLMFISIITKIPLIIIGKPGCSKSLSFHLIIKSMKGNMSNNNFFKFYPKIIRSCLQGSTTTTSKGVLNIFKIANEKLESFINGKDKDNNNDFPMSLIFFDKLGLAEQSKENPLKVIHSYLEYDDKIDINHKIAFIGISNWTLDAAKMNRAIFLYVPELDSDLDNINDSMVSIVESINPLLYEKYGSIFLNLSRAYFEFKKSLKGSKYFDLISSRDFYHLIKYCAYKINSIDEKYKNKKSPHKIIMLHIKIAIERNFAGFELEENEIEKYKGAKDSVMLFKQKYNEIMINYKIDKINEKYNVIEK